MSYIDVNGRRGYTMMEGSSGSTYGDLRLLTNLELAMALDDGITKIKPKVNTPVPPTLHQLREGKKTEVRSGYTADSEKPVPVQLVVDGPIVSYDGGYSSATSMYSAIQLAELQTSPVVILWDANNNEHELSLLDGKKVVIAVANAFHALFKKKQSLMVEIEAATTKEQLEAIAW